MTGQTLLIIFGLITLSQVVTPRTTANPNQEKSTASCPPEYLTVRHFMSECERRMFSMTSVRAEACFGMTENGIKIDCKNDYCTNSTAKVYWVIPGSNERISKDDCCDVPLRECKDQIKTCADHETRCKSQASSSLNEAKCVVNRCRGCRIEWFMGNDEVTELCDGYANNKPDTTPVSMHGSVDWNRFEPSY